MKVFRVLFAAFSLMGFAACSDGIIPTDSTGNGNFLGGNAFKAVVSVNDESSSYQLTFTIKKTQNGYPNSEGFVWTLNNAYQVMPTTSDGQQMLLIIPNLAAGSYQGDPTTMYTATLMVDRGGGSQVMSYSWAGDSKCNFTVTQGGVANGDKITGTFSGELYSLEGYRHWSLTNGRFEGYLSSISVFNY